VGKVFFTLENDVKNQRVPPKTTMSDHYHAMLYSQPVKLLKKNNKIPHYN